LLYGGLMALLALLLKAFEYHFFARHLRLEVYLSIVALLFTALGIWLGLRLTARRRAGVPAQALSSPAPREQQLARLGISIREYEVLQLIARGCSNREIAQHLFISLNTVKTHSSNLFAKLDVQRRTQAVRRARELHLLDDQPAVGMAEP
jgi:DNA-binding CsgD family transcriptional regulator